MNNVSKDDTRGRGSTAFFFSVNLVPLAVAKKVSVKSEKKIGWMPTLISCPRHTVWLSKAFVATLDVVETKEILAVPPPWL